MIHLLQVLCGPARHCIYAILYKDDDLSPGDARDGVEALIEMWVDHGMIRRRCELCDAPVAQFRYEDGVTKEQDWDKAQAITEQLAEEQRTTQQIVLAERRARKN